MGLDIESVAQKHNLTTQEVIALHTAKTYRVFMNGFCGPYFFAFLVFSPLRPTLELTV